MCHQLSILLVFKTLLFWENWLPTQSHIGRKLYDCCVCIYFLLISLSLSSQKTFSISLSSTVHVSLFLSFPQEYKWLFFSSLIPQKYISYLPFSLSSILYVSLSLSFPPPPPPEYKCLPIHIIITVPIFNTFVSLLCHSQCNCVCYYYPLLCLPLTLALPDILMRSVPRSASRAQPSWY